MGPTLETQGKITSFCGVKGGVGCSILASLLGRIAAKKNPKKIAVIDAVPFSYSQLPSYLSISSSSHYLTQLQPYQDQLPSSMVENFFSFSPEGTAYIPIKASDETQIPFPDLFPLIQRLNHWFSEIFIDLSSFPSDQYFYFFEKSHRVFFISSLEPTSLAAAKQWEKRILPFHFHLKSFGIIFNEENSNRSAPKDIHMWTKNLNHIGNIPFLGENLSMDLFENQTITPFIEKTLSPVLDKVFLSQTSVNEPDSLQAGPLNREKTEPSHSLISLEQIHQLHQKLLDRLRRSGALKDQKTDENLQRQILEP